VQVKLIDFGLCDVLESDADSNQNIASCGTVDYAAPEVITAAIRPRRAAQFDGAKSDIWSLSLVLFIMRFWQYPFSRSQRIASLRRGETHPPLRFPEGVETSPEFKDLVEGMMEIDPERRLGIRDALAHPWTRHSVFPASRMS
jgi:serine/threonine protein kinase